MADPVTISAASFYEAQCVPGSVGQVDVASERTHIYPFVPDGCTHGLIVIVQGYEGRILLREEKGKLRVPGTNVRPGETIAMAAGRVLHEKLGVPHGMQGLLIFSYTEYPDIRSERAKREGKVFSTALFREEKGKEVVWPKTVGEWVTPNLLSYFLSPHEGERESDQIALLCIDLVANQFRSVLKR